MKIRIGVGLGQWPFAEKGPEALLDFVDYCESLDIDSLWLSDRIISSAVTLEPITFLAYMASRMRNMKFGTSALVLPVRNPVILAKQLATLDFLSYGRLLLVVGLGSDESKDFQATGVRKEERGKRTDEAIILMRKLWTEENVTRLRRRPRAVPVDECGAGTHRSLGEGGLCADASADCAAPLGCHGLRPWGSTRRSVLARRSQVLRRFMRAMAEAAVVLHADKEFSLKVLGKRLRVADRKVVESLYDAEIKALEQRLDIRPEALQAILDEFHPTTDVFSLASQAPYLAA